MSTISKLAACFSRHLERRESAPLDLGKNICSVVGLDDGGRVLVRRRLKRPAVIAFARQSPGCVVAMEACCGAHHLARQLAAQGHEVRLMSPEYVRPYVKAQKNDDRDAEAIAEASLRPTMRFVPLKSEAQSDLQSLHRARERLITERTALINHLRAVLLERGIIIAQGRRKLEKALPGILADAASGMSPRIRQLIGDLCEEWHMLDRRIANFDAELVSLARTDEAARRLASVPGIGTITATALVAAVGDGSAFGRGRDMAAWLGLVPRQATTGGKPRLLGISKRGNRYLRKNLIHGARSVLPYLVRRDTPLGRWVMGLMTRAHKNTVVVALANKLARIAWAVLVRGRGFGSSAIASASQALRYPSVRSSTSLTKRSYRIASRGAGHPIISDPNPAQYLLFQRNRPKAAVRIDPAHVGA